jgi:SAM-dependent methyltransferase
MNFLLTQNLNIGCGPELKEGFINYDINPCGDVCGDCEQGLPFKDSVFDNILASHILEHTHNLRKFKKEILRVLKPGGELVVIVPYYLSPDAWGDDTHCRAFSDQSFFSNFWPGFKVNKIAHESRIKTFNKEKIEWIYAFLQSLY